MGREGMTGNWTSKSKAREKGKREMIEQREIIDKGR